MHYFLHLQNFDSSDYPLTFSGFKKLYDSLRLAQTSIFFNSSVKSFMISIRWAKVSVNYFSKRYKFINQPFDNIMLKCYRYFLLY